MKLLVSAKMSTRYSATVVAAVLPAGSMACAIPVPYLSYITKTGLFPPSH
ncbi:hypothetical protein ABS755_10780 [Castellaniella sp. FW104-16D08]